MEKGGILAVGGGNGKDFYTGSSLKRHHSSKDIKLESKSCSSLPGTRGLQADGRANVKVMIIEETARTAI